MLAVDAENCACSKNRAACASLAGTLGTGCGDGEGDGDGDGDGDGEAPLPAPPPPPPPQAVSAATLPANALRAASRLDGGTGDDGNNSGSLTGAAPSVAAAWVVERDIGGAVMVRMLVVDQPRMFCWANQAPTKFLTPHAALRATVSTMR